MLSTFTQSKSDHSIPSDSQPEYLYFVCAWASSEVYTLFATDLDIIRGWVANKVLIASAKENLQAKNKN